MVKIGSARSDERGRAHGGKSGDQKSGREVSTQGYYVHSKGWRVLRCVDADKALRIARAMQAACATNLIGYDQWQRDTLYKAVKDKGFDIAQLTKAVETDCSALVRVCVAYAYGYDVITGDSRFSTSNMCARLLKTGFFTELKGTKYTKQDKYLKRGDILCTKTQGHTVVVLTDGSRADEDAPPEPIYTLGDRALYNGCEGSDVKELQTLLISLGYDCGRWGADGDYGDATELAVMAFQKSTGLDADGTYGPETHAALMKALAEADKPVEEARRVRIVGGDCWVRTAPNTQGAKLGVAKAGEVLAYGGEESEHGWLLVAYRPEGATVPCNGWVSGKYGALEEGA